MGCYCDYSDGPSFFNEKLLVARKEHKCCECGHIIQPGERYQRATGMWESFASFKTCEPCADLRESLEEIMCPPPFGDMLSEYLNELLNWKDYDEAEALIKRIEARHRS